MDDMQIVEREKVVEGSPIIITGLPDVGLVGAIASIHLIKKLSMKEYGHVEYDLIPPVIILHEGEIKAPVRLYSKGKIVTLISEITLPTETLMKLSKKIAEYAKEKESRHVIMLSGLVTPNRLDIEKPKVYGIATRREDREMLEKNGITLLKEGYVTGINALILRECMKKNISAIILLAESFNEFPDPAAAAANLEALSKITGIKVDVKELIVKAEEIRLKARELMRRTQQQLKALKKVSETEIPLMYR
ncbi:MAG: PAC2 family protein [archaeon GB-1867-097]|nr:PAC2 family protein [Candidatus Culexmicrobium thermophilum]